MAMQTLEWEDVAGDSMYRHSRDGRYLWVCDEQYGHAAVLPPNMLMADALEDYAAGYDAGDYKGEIEVRWQIWDRGEMVASGAHTFKK